MSMVKRENFDELYGFVIKLSDLSARVKDQLITILCRGCEQLLTKVKPCSNGTDNQKKFDCRNSIKMFSFLLCVIVRTLEREQRSASPRV